MQLYFQANNAAVRWLLDKDISGLVYWLFDFSYLPLLFILVIKLLKLFRLICNGLCIY